MRILPILLVIFLPAVLATAAAAQTTRPVSAELEIRAAEAFAGSDYATALPMLERIRSDATIDPLKRERIDEMIRVARKNLPPSTAVLPAGRPSRPSAAEAPRTPHVRPADGAPLAMTIKQLGNFPYDSDGGGKIPDDVVALSGATVRIPGYMLPIDQADKITRFALVADLAACCFGQPPSVEHTLMVTCPPGKALSYYPDPVVVTGTLKVEEKKDGEFVVSLFEIQAQSVKPAPR